MGLKCAEQGAYTKMAIYLTTSGLEQAASYDFLPQPSLALFYDKAVGWPIYKQTSTEYI